MLERECVILDIKLGGERAENQNLIDKYSKVKELENGIISCEEKIQLVYEAITYNVAKNPQNEEQILAIYHPRLKYLQDKVKTKVNNTF